MQFKEAFALGDGPTEDTTQRYVFMMPGDNFMVVKVFPINTKSNHHKGYTVKLWSGELDYKRTVNSWATKTKFVPSAARIRDIENTAIELLEECGFGPFSLVNRR